MIHSFQRKYAFNILADFKMLSNKRPSYIPVLEFEQDTFIYRIKIHGSKTY